MRYYPLFVDTQNRTIAIVGGNLAALNKYRLIKRTEATIRVFADGVVDEFESELVADGIDMSPISFFFDDNQYLAVFIADEREHIVNHVKHFCSTSNIALNVIDKPDACTFFTPAIVDRSPLVIAIGTEGIAPVLARHIKSNLEQQIPEETGAFLEFMRSKRDWLAQELGSSKKRRDFWRKLMPLKDPFTIVRQGGAFWLTRFQEIVSIVKNSDSVNKLTVLRSKKIHEYNLDERIQLQSADIVIYEKGVDRMVVDLARRDAIFLQSEVGETSRQIECLNKNGHNIVVIEAPTLVSYERMLNDKSLRLSA